MSESSPDQHRVTRGKFRLGRLLSGRATSPVRPAKHHPVKEDIDALAKRILLPSLPVSDEEMARAAHQDRGQKLARQEMWDTLSEKLRYADRSRLSTPGGETASLLLAFGARSDVVSAAEDALHDGKVPDMAGIEALEEMQADYPTEYPCALIVAPGIRQRRPDHRVRGRRVCGLRRWPATGAKGSGRASGSRP